jgi:hypothetical protein
MADTLKIWNRALHYAGELRVSSLTEESVNGRLMRDVYEEDKKAVLEMHSWKFARELVELVATTAPDFGYTKAYQLPTDFIRIVSFNNTDPEYRERKFFSIVGQELHTSQDSAKITYIKDVVAPGLFTPGFVDALARHLSRTIAYTRTKSQPLMDRADVLFDKALAKAKRSDAAGDHSPPSALSAYPNISARGSSYGSTAYTTST